MSKEWEFDRDGPKRPSRLIRIKEVQYRTGLGRSTIYRWMNQGKFPKSVRLGSFLVAWHEDEIESWIAGDDDDYLRRIV
ncbi:helix-turn-helix transcriptional regulator [Croceicoccus hydrothermalis]|uniref:helix-turn-helix transcriptional regulator n=1 Tax=Croceicoccus hydrothermalis TaxID=2867964 RepID=UPI001EFBFBF3|nr:AlpA family transcriptional regulator [Croceicoccus hydrothermalis]